MSDTPLTLVADIGGTNTRVALADGTTLIDGSVRRYRNAEQGSLNDALDKYIDETGVRPVAACIAGAGPVMDGVLQMTNLSWRIDGVSVSAATGAETVAVLNDLQAQGHALNLLSGGDLRPLLNNDGPDARSHGTKLVIGLGTGVNIAMVFHHGGLTLVPPSEAGHTILPLRHADELGLADFLASEGGFPSVEEALAGRGIEALYRWRQNETGKSGRKAAADVMASVAAGDDASATEAAEFYVRFIGRVASDIALMQLPFGGIYFIGGVSRSLAPYFTPMGFDASFHDKGRFSDFLRQFPVWLVENDDAALLGCASHMAELRG